MNSILRSLAGGLILLLLMLSSAWAEETYELDIADQELSSALKTFAEQSGLQVVYFADLAAGKQAKGVHGTYSADAALTELLDDTDLTYSTVDDRTYAISGAPAAEDAGGDSDSGNGRTAGATPRPVMMAQAAAEQSQTSRRTETDSDEDEKKRPLEEITVTGTNIRGIAPESSPVHVYDREDIQISGAATAQDFVQTLPQNFGGGSNARIFANLPGDSSAAFNSGVSGSMGSSVNLRGLGSGSTLVLLNGHRLAPSSGLGDFVDISMIPASAIERVEVLTDGASSIYGSDAVAGVTNFILRDDFEGLETSLRYGVGTQHGSPEEFRASATGGLNWDSGHALVSYEYSNQDELGAQDRTFSQEVPFLPFHILPGQERHSVLGSLSQDFMSNLEVFADVAFSRRESARAFTSPSGLVVNLSPTSKNLNIFAGGTWTVTDSWFVDFSGGYSEVATSTLEFVESDFTSEKEVNSKFWGADIITSGTILQLPGGDLKLAIGGHLQTEDFTSFDVLDGEVDREADRDVYAAFGEVIIPIVGPDNAIPGFKRLELNVSGRYDHYSDFGSTANPKVGVLWSPFQGLRLRGSYSTSFNPPPLGRVGAKDLIANAFDLSFILPVFGPVFGLATPPADSSIADAILLNLGGTSKDLDAENSTAYTAGLDYNHQWGRHDVALSATWFDIDFENRLGTTPIPDRRNFFDAPTIAFTDPNAFPEGTIIFNPSLAQLNDVFNSADRVFGSAQTTSPLFGDPLDATIISNVSIIRNLSGTFVNGLDFDIVYTYESSIGDLTFGIDGTYLNEFKQQAIVTTPAVDNISTLFQPVDLKLRGRAGYANNGFAANVFVNYLNDYHTDNTANAMRIDSWTTVDLSLSYDTQEHLGNSILNDAVFRLSVLNLFDQDPPATPSTPTLGVLGYDPTNASPLGRFVAFEVTKRFGKPR